MRHSGDFWGGFAAMLVARLRPWCFASSCIQPIGPVTHQRQCGVDLIIIGRQLLKFDEAVCLRRIASVCAKL